MGIRAVRWQGLLAPIGLVSFGNAFRTTIIGFGASFLLPARAGEVIRPYLLARREGFSATAAFATIIFERVLDLVSVTLLLGVFVALFDPGMADRHRLLYNAVQVGGLVGAITAVGLLAAMFALAGRPEAAAQAASRLEHLLPERAARGVSRLGRLFCLGPGRAGLSGGGRVHASRHEPPGQYGQGGGAGRVKCPYCAHLGDKVVDSRESREGEVIRRRRECLSCRRRFTSYERIDGIPYMGGKKDGSREGFAR